MTAIREECLGRNERDIIAKVMKHDLMFRPHPSSSLSSSYYLAFQPFAVCVPGLKDIEALHPLFLLLLIKNS